LKSLYNFTTTEVAHALVTLHTTWDRCYDFKNISAKKFGENIGVFFAQTTASFCKNVIITLVFEKNPNYFAKNWQTSQKIVIITSTPGIVVC
jgi:hypothetical protein